MPNQFLYLPETDQTRCYAEDGRPIACAETGQDGARKKRSWQTANERFQVGDEVVRDTLTGALWTRNANPAGFPLNWNEAQEYVANMGAQGANGRDDWQLPSRRALFTLVSHQHINPALPSDHPFKNVFSGYYWTTETVVRLPDQAWYIHLGGGRVHRGMKQGSYLVWPVSPGHPGTARPGRSAKNRFVVAASCVFDTHTGLTWRQDADLGGRRLSWQEALVAIRNFNDQHTGGRGDWRLPNIRELESLVDLKAHSPALPAGHPFINVQEAYWSSTTSVYEPRYAWVLYGRDGMVGVGFKPGADFFLWPVRNE